MGLYDHWPYTNFHELNLSWLLHRMEDLSNVVENFVALNTIKYADPIQWNITKQYEKNTVVIDGLTGTAYLSTQPVPSGVALSNTDYWNVIFTLDILSVNQNLTLRDDGANILSTFASNAEDWLLWNSTLYRVTQAINVNEAYVVGYNIERYTVELFIKDYIANLISIIGDLDDLTTSDKTSIVDAINSLLTDIGNTIGDLDDLATSDKTDIVEAINSLLTDINNTIGDLNNLTTTDKTDIVGAINEVNSKHPAVVNVRDFGAVGDAKYYDKSSNKYYADAGFTTPPTNDYTAIQNAIAYAIANNIGVVYFPSGSYYCGDGTFNIGEDSVSFFGDIGSELISEDLSSGAFITLNAGSKYPPASCVLEGLTILGNYFQNNMAVNTVHALDYGTGSWMQGRTIRNIGIANFNIGIYFEGATEFHLDNSKIILCDTAVYFGGSGSYNPMPAWFNNVTIELNALGINGSKGGYSTLFLTNCGLSGGSQLYKGYANLRMTGCRMEFALDDMADINNNPLSPIQIIGNSGAGISGVTFDNCQFLFTAGGGNIGKLLFWTGTTYTANADHEYIINMQNSYADSDVPVIFTNCQILPGSKRVKRMVNQYGYNFRVGCSGIYTPLYNDTCIALGNDIMYSGKLADWSANITKSGDNYVVSTDTTIRLDPPRNATAINVHIEPIGSSVTVTIKPMQKDLYYGYHQVSRTIPVNGTIDQQTLATRVMPNVEGIDLTFSAGTFDAREGHFWVEFIF